MKNSAKTKPIQRPWKNKDKFEIRISSALLKKCLLTGLKQHGLLPEHTIYPREVRCFRVGKTGEEMAAIITWEE